MVLRRCATSLALNGLILAGANGIDSKLALGSEGNQVSQEAQCRVLSIEGMTCESCAAHVQKALLKVPGVAEAKVNYSKGEATVCSKARADVSVASLTDTVKRAGYKATLKL